MVLTPCTAGEGLKKKVIVVLPFNRVAESAGIPFTVKSLASRVAGSTGSLTSTMKTSGGVVTTMPQAGLVTEQPTSSLSVNTSPWDVLLMATRPSVHEVTCLVRIAEP